MTNITDLKIVVLAATIALATVVCGQNEDRLGQVEPVLMNAPFIETMVLAG